MCRQGMGNMPCHAKGRQVHLEDSGLQANKQNITLPQRLGMYRKTRVCRQRDECMSAIEKGRQM